MLTLMNRAFEPTLSFSDKITYMTSIKHLQSVRSDNSIVVENIKDLLTSTSTRLQGLQLLELALQQNSEIYLKGRWCIILSDILKESGAHILKEHACKILCMIIPFMAKDHASNSVDLQKFAKDLFPLLLRKVDKNVEWTEAACKCIYTCLKSFPHALESHRDYILSIILRQVSYSVSSEKFEIFADCFAELPNCIKSLNVESYQQLWLKQYLTTLNTMQQVLNTFFTFVTDDSYTDLRLSDIEVYPFEDDDHNLDVYPAYLKGVRRFINLCRCLAKMLSSKSRFPVQIPVKLTLACVTRLFQDQDFAKVKATTPELQIVFSTLSQMQVTSLVVLESLILNCNLVPHSWLISEIMDSALKISKLTNISAEIISPLRQAVWKLLDIWSNIHGNKVIDDIVSRRHRIIRELLEDISIKELSEASAVQTSTKSKKNVCTGLGSKSYLNKSHQAVCIEALKTLESFLHTGACFFSKELIQEIFNKIKQIAYALRISSQSYPFPYDDDLCRKNLYSVLLAMTVASKSDQREPAQCVSGIFKSALRDPSIEVTRVCHRGMATCRLYLHPKRPPPEYRDTDNKQISGVSSAAVVKYPEWSSQDYVPNLPLENVSKIPENVNPRIAQTFHDPNESEMHNDEYMEVQPCYSEQAEENQCNGEDLLEIQNSSQCQDDVESEDEDEEDDDERSYGEEEINQEITIPPDNIYIPSTSKLQVLNPVHINPETVPQNAGEREYEELRPCVKTEDNIVDSNKNMHLNGARNIVPDEDIQPSSIQPSVASENGIYGYEDEDLDEEDCEEEEEEENITFPAEKKVPEFYETPSKKQKLENDEVKGGSQNEERERDSRSPTLQEMKADFCCNEIDDVKS